MPGEVSDYDVVLFYGRPCVGKTVYYFQNLQPTHKRLCPQAFFRQHPDRNIRQMVNTEIVQPLREGQKIVIDDTNDKASKRQTYLQLLQKKVPEASVCCVEFSAKYGKEQELWSIETSGTTSSTGQGQAGSGDSDWQLDNWEKWMQESEEPKEEEGFEVHTVTLPLQIQSAYKLEVPALFIQWEGLVKFKDGAVSVLPGVTKALSVWYHENPCGRVIIIHDGITTPGVSLGHRDSHIRHVLKEITKQVTECPVFLLHVEDQQTSGVHATPPNLGLVAYLHRLHHINLNSQRTMYLYSTSSHMKMAERAGIRHIKAARVFSSPHLAKSSHSARCPDIPAMLSDLEVIDPTIIGREPSQAQVPLCNQLLDCGQSLYQCLMSRGRSMYVAVGDIDTAESYLHEYQRLATAVSSSENSKISEPTLQPSCDQKSHDHSVQQKTLYSQRSSSASLGVKGRDLPKWMFPKKENRGSVLGTQEVASLKEESVPSESKTKPPTLKTVGSTTMYVMDETELLETAKMILQEAGQPVPTEEDIALYVSQHSPGGATELPVITDQIKVESQKPEQQELPAAGVDDVTSQESLDDDEKEVLSGLFEDINKQHRGRRPTFASRSVAEDQDHQFVVPETHETRSASYKPSISVADSLVAQSQLKSQRPSHPMPVPTTPSETGGPTVGTSLRVGDSFVPDTVTTVPETVDVPRGKKPRTRAQDPDTDSKTKKSPAKKSKLETDSDLDFDMIDKIFF